VARKCAFCEREVTLTLEHVFPQWIGSVLPPADSVIHIHKTEGEVTRAHTAPKMEAKVKRVCERCNTGWMEALEGAARLVLPGLIRPRRDHVGLAPIEQEIVSVWAVKTALMCEFMDPHTASAPRSDFQTIFRTLTPPPGTNVWLAAYDGPKELDYNHRRLTFSGVNVGVPDRRGYLTAFIIGRLVIYVMGVEADSPWIYRMSKESQRRAIPIQPRRWVFPKWPPPVVLRGDEAVESFLLAVAPNRTEDRASTENG
jgi:hypothetical protein